MPRAVIARMPVYRDKDVELSMAAEFRALVEDLPPAAFTNADARAFLLDYPTHAWPGASSFLYWQETSFGLKPTLRLSHVTVHEGTGEVVVVSKMIYAHHYFRSALELRGPCAGPRAWWLLADDRQ